MSTPGYTYSSSLTPPGFFSGRANVRHLYQPYRRPHPRIPLPHKSISVRHHLQPPERFPYVFRLHRRSPFLLHLEQPASRDTLCAGRVGIASAGLSVYGGGGSVSGGAVGAAAAPGPLAFLIIGPGGGGGRPSGVSARCVRARTLLSAFLALFDSDGFFRDRLHDFKGQKAKDVNDVVVGLGVRDDAEAGPLAEAFTFPKGERSLATVRPEDVLVARHVARAFVGAGEPGERSFVLFFFGVVGFVFDVVGGEGGGVGIGCCDAVGGRFGEKGVNFPGED